MLELTATKQGTLLPVKVTANAKRTALLGLHGGALKVACREASLVGLKCQCDDIAHESHVLAYIFGQPVVGAPHQVW